MALNTKTLLAILSRQAISRKITFCKTEIMNSIQQISFPHTITSANTYNTFSEKELLLVIIFKLKKLYRLYEKAQIKNLKLKIQAASFTVMVYNFSLIG